MQVEKIYRMIRGVIFETIPFILLARYVGVVKKTHKLWLLPSSSGFKWITNSRWRICGGFPLILTTSCKTCTDSERKNSGSPPMLSASCKNFGNSWRKNSDCLPMLSANCKTFSNSLTKSANCPLMPRTSWWKINSNSWKKSAGYPLILNAS